MNRRTRHDAGLPEHLEEWLRRVLPQFPQVSLCVALSGGVDSIALLAAMVEVRRSFRHLRLRAVHVHHGLHPNADGWLRHCKRVAAGLHVPLSTVRVQVSRERGTSLEAAAREARYDAFAKVLGRDEVLLTAHHEDDQLETVLLQLMRGAGVAGLAAMPEITRFGAGWLARPLLTRNRAELEAWVRSRGLAWVDDDTNANEQFDRNYLRRRVLPLIRNRWPGAARAVSRSARHAAEAKRLLDSLGRADVERAAVGSGLSVQRLRALDPDRRRNAIRFWIAEAGHVLPDATRLDQIAQHLLTARPDANPQVEWNGTRVYRHADTLTLQALPSRPARLRATATAAESRDHSDAQPAGADGEGAQPEIVWQWRENARLDLGAGRGTLLLGPDPHGPIDLDALPGRLVVRNRRGGESLRPHPKGRTRTLKALVQEARLPLQERERLPLLFSDTRLIAAGDRWIDASVHATGATTRRGRLRWLQNA